MHGMQIYPLRQPRGTRHSLGTFLVLLLLCGIAWTANAEPQWFAQPPGDDADFIYQTGYVEKRRDRNDAQDAAYRAALQRLANRIAVTVRASAEDRVRETVRGGRRGKTESDSFFETDIQTVATHQLIGVDIVREECSERRGQWEAWVLVSYPAAQYRKAMERVPDLVAERQRMDEAQRLRNEDPRLPLLVCPMAFGAESEEQFPQVVAEFRSKGYGNAIWQTVEDKLYESKRFLFVAPPQQQVRSMLEQILGRAPDPAQQKLPRRFLLCNMNFFEAKNERLSFGSVARSTEYHVELMLEYYNLDGQYTNIKIPAKGEARDRDLLKATGQAAVAAIERLLKRIKEEEG
jgi:hypothetical protein